MDEICFEWDEDKEQINIKKHGIDFETAAYVFNDPNRIEYYDSEHSKVEDRYITVGLVGDLIVVVYTIREPKYRIISARIAKDKERKRYRDGY